MTLMKTILLVEDDENDVYFMKQAATKVNMRNPMHVACDGQEALNYFKGEGNFKDRTQFALPSLVLLDLKLPRVMGMEVLKWIRQQPEFKTLAVIVMTSSELQSDIKAAYSYGATSYLVKPALPAELCQMLTGMKAHWE
ncbi:MAG: response regulator [Verrucomicrobiales bacterium]|nr:response regulator [Verrucomicrobiales bacterium]